MKSVEVSTVIGTLATCASTASFTPQAWKVIKSRKTSDISAGMYALTVVGFALWTAYGIVLGRWPLIATNAICFAFASFILVMKLLPRRDKDRVANILDPSSPN
jgi:MtN3 and saliva related transmembrane protein